MGEGAVEAAGREQRHRAGRGRSYRTIHKVLRELGEVLGRAGDGALGPAAGWTCGGGGTRGRRSDGSAGR
ncbi:hypothetical protein GCM10028832_27090 [Streptomyces sparsus]